MSAIYSFLKYLSDTKASGGNVEKPQLSYDHLGANHFFTLSDLARVWSSDQL